MSADVHDLNEARETGVVYASTWQMEEFKKRLESLNKKAIAYGLEPVKILNDVKRPFVRRVVDAGENAVASKLVPWTPGYVEDVVLLHRIELEYPQIKLGNWEVVGKLEVMPEGNLMFSVTNREEDKAELRVRAEHPIECDHCQTNRKRKEGFLLRSVESGEYKEVGSSCLEDFTGIDPSAVLFMARLYDYIKVCEGGEADFLNSGEVHAHHAQTLLSKVSFLSENGGFVSAAKARERGCPATFEVASFLWKDVVQRDAELQEKYKNEFDHHYEVAGNVIGWIRGKSPDSDFERNAKLILSEDYVEIDRRRLAIAAATVAGYARSLQIEKDVKRMKASEHVGEIGKRIDGVLSVERIIPIEGRYGMSDIVIFSDAEGNTLKWKTSARPEEMKVGERFEGSFKVKEHEFYGNDELPQTAVTHVKASRWLSSEMVPELKELRASESESALTLDT